MTDATLIDTLEFGSDSRKQKYEIYGVDAQTPTHAVIYRQQDGEWQALDETLSFAAQDEQEEVTGSMGYGAGDSLPDLRDLPAEARERCEQHWHESRDE
ncbi:MULTISPECIES: hypothetical protein [Pantoea]|jgi:hypothetical protein|uniref:Uncharacterized protein n=1 Tax=Pantoea brenneri TaxID=472694 RepID=A0A7Y6NI32_9GAMM|nr:MULTISPECIES: hypothetical protein [Pantoea]MBZ6397372.1 hypothetical protein [Pantoea sp.]MBZ6440591.1 hypothetical protein [Pantoea sp.]MDU4128486.1 hypothetical protein [Pantoea sp.]MDU7866161.1 hypothetical protein [Pantoea sp.]NUY43941.1 hypothetical protein [Pantoea brenneri]